jgi:hypothetical protein
MQILDSKATPENIPTTKEKLLTRPLPGWFNATNFLWAAASLLALIFGAYLLVAQPVTVKTWDADHLTEAVPDKNDYRLYQPETDASGQRFVWTNPDKALFVVPANTNNSRPVKITVRARGASAAQGGPVNTTKVSANGVEVGEIKPAPGQAEFQDFSFELNGPYSDDHRLRLTFDTPAWQPKGDPRQLGFMLQSVTVDTQEIWSPMLRPGRVWLIWLLPLLAGLMLVVKLAQLTILRQSGIAALGGYVAVGLTLAAAGLMALWLLLLMRVGYNGELNHDLFWLYAAGSLYLAGFFGWLAIAGWSWGRAGQPPLLDRLAARTQSWRIAHPVIVAFAAILAFNLLLSAVFVGKLVLESGSIAPTFRYWDGPEYVVIANNFYDPQEPLLVIPDFKQHSPFYWGAHFPGFPVALMLAHPLIGWLWSPLAVNFLASALFAWVFYLLVRDFGYTRHPLWLALVALVLPVRWLIYHNVGGSEPLFMLFEVLAVYWFKKERYWLAGLAGFGAVFTRPPGMFLWVGFMLFLLFEAAIKTWNAHGLSLPKLLAAINWRAVIALLLLPLGLVVVFGIYGWRYGDFMAYFKITENVTHVEVIPFPTLLTGLFESPALIFTYVLETMGLVFLWRQRRFDLFWIGGASFFYTLFLLHSDVLRYSIPFFALVVLIPFADYFSGKVARWLAAPLLLALFFYSWGVLNRNLAGLDTFEMMQNILQIKLK